MKEVTIRTAGTYEVMLLGFARAAALGGGMHPTALLGRVEAQDVPPAALLQQVDKCWRAIMDNLKYGDGPRPNSLQLNWRDGDLSLNWTSSEGTSIQLCLNEGMMSMIRVSGEPDRVIRRAMAAGVGLQWQPCEPRYEDQERNVAEAVAMALGEELPPAETSKEELALKVGGDVPRRQLRR